MCFLGFCTIAFVGLNILVIIADPPMQMSWNKLIPLIMGYIIFVPLIGMWFIESDDVTPCKERVKQQE